MNDSMILDLTKEAETVFSEQSALVRTTTNPLVRAVLGTAPFGGGVASILGDIAQKRIEIRLRRFLLSVARRVQAAEETIRQKIDCDFVSSEEFAATLQSILEETARTSDATKMQYLRDFIIASGFKTRPDTSWREIFMQYVRQLSGAHLAVLGSVYEVQGQMPESDRLGGIEIAGRVPLSLSEIRKRTQGFDELLVKVTCIDLTNLGLLVDWRLLASEDKALQQRFVISQSGVLFFRFLVGRWK